MKYFYTPVLGLVHKVQVVATEAGVYDRMEKHVTLPGADDPVFLAANPFGKLPTLVTDQGEALYGGPVIYAYLDSLHDGPPMLPRDGMARWVDLRRLSHGDLLFDISNAHDAERGRPADAERDRRVAHYAAQVRRGLDRLETEVAVFSGFTLGQISIAVTLMYFDFKRGRGRIDWDWRDGRSGLLKWFDRFIDRPSFRARDEEVSS